jgi:glycine dehydrogenase subunit 2
MAKLGYRFPPLDVPKRSPLRFARETAPPLPELSELEVIRHFTRLSRANHGVEQGTVLLGGASVRYQPRFIDRLLAEPGLARLHPELPPELAQGALEIVHRVESLLIALTGMDACSARTGAGPEGLAVGLGVIRRFQETHGSRRRLVLVREDELALREPACLWAGYRPVPVRISERGVLEIEGTGGMERLLREHGRDIAALVLSNPGPHGHFESRVREIAQSLHELGAQVLLDGGGLHALFGVARAHDMGVDLVHWELHHAFATRPGAYGPDAAPLLCRHHLAPYLPGPRVIASPQSGPQRGETAKYMLEEPPQSVGRVRDGLGNFGSLCRALAYLLEQGGEGLKRGSRASVLNANYLRHRLSAHFDVLAPGPSLHEFIIGLPPHHGRAISEEALARAMVERGFHPPALGSFGGVPGAIRVEVTEAESLRELDAWADAFIAVVSAVRNGADIDHSGTEKFVGEMGRQVGSDGPQLPADDRH